MSDADVAPARRARVLIVAGSDSGGGAGIQADVKTVTALGGYAATAITAITVQNTMGVSAVHEAPVEIVVAQMRAVIEDIGADAIKLGMLHNIAVIEAVAAELDASAAGIPVIADPVMVAKGGARLLEPDAVATLRREILPRATVLTPNLPEAAALLGRPVNSVADMRAALADLLALGPQAVLLKGGHLPGDEVIDLFASRGHGEILTSAAPRIATRHTHGTGCTLASAVAVGVAEGRGAAEAVGRARAYVREAVRRAPGFGNGSGPLDHGWTVAAAALDDL